MSSRKRIVAITAAVGVAIAGAAAAIIPMTSSNAAAACAPAYSASAVYWGTNVASHNGRNWQAKWWTQGETPSTGGTGVWADNGACGGGGTVPPPPPPPPNNNCNHPNWAQGTNYPAGSIVKYTNGQYYRAKHENPGYDPVISTWFWEPFSCTGGGGGTTPPPNTGGGAFPISKQQFESLYPNRNPFYTYEGIIQALDKFPQVTKTGDDATRKREAAAILANWAQETGEFVYVEEIAKADYCQAGPPGCAPGKRYYGRGPTQLSWNYNYDTVGRVLGLNLWADPDLVARDPKVAMMTGFWYWTNGRGPGGPTPHEAMTAGNGFGATIRAINSIECNGGYPAKMQNRVDRYKKYTAMLGVDPGGNLTC